MGVSPLVITALLMCAPLCWGAVSRQKLEIMPGHENQCWISKMNRFYDVGDAWAEPGCVRGTCQGIGDMVERVSCGTVSCGPGLKKVKADDKKPYPDCCVQGCEPV